MPRKPKDKSRNRNQPVPQNQSSPSETGSTPSSAILRSTSVTTSFKGPIPPPIILAQYEEVVPGSAERLLAMVESQSAHRQALEKTVVNGDSKRAYLGLAAGFIVALAVVSGGGFLVYNGHDWAGASIITTVVVGLVGVFVYGTQTRKAERQEKQRNAPAPGKRRK